MVQLTNSVAQTVPAGGAVTFDTVLLKSGPAECYNRQIPTSVKLKCNGVYLVHFSGNISGAAAGTPVQLAIALGGVAQPATVMVSTPAEANAFNNVSKTFLVKNCCCDLDRVSVVNSGTVDTLVSANLVLSVRRVA